MNICFSGNLDAVSRSFYKKIESEHKCIHRDERKMQNKDMQKMFSAYDFDTVVFFSNNINGERKIFDEMESLEQILFDCKRNQVRHFLYITGNDLKRLEISGLEKTTREVFEDSCISLCKTYSEKSETSITVLSIPYLYNLEGKGNGLAKWIFESLENISHVVHADVNAETDFLCDEDLAELLLRIFSEPFEQLFLHIYISGENRIRFRDLESVVRTSIAKFTMQYTGQKQGYPCFFKTMEARERLGWYPQHILADDIKTMTENIRGRLHDVRRSKKRIQKYGSLFSGMRAFLEITLGFILSEGLNYLIKDNIMLQFIDCRLVYVAVIGILNGLNASMVAVILSCIGYVFSITGQTPWQVVFYNVENWLPFACYLLMGAISGYSKDKHETKIQFAQEETEILEQKYEFLTELYEQVMNSKNGYNSQIIGYKDSFGKIYSIVKKLDVTKASEVFLEAVDVIEELMDNSSVAIYTFHLNSDYARLNVCSKKLNDALSKSRKLSDMPEVIMKLSEREIFVNTECKQGYPQYAAPIYNDQSLVGMIVLNEASIKQMNMEYKNKFVIITDLIKDALVRAVERENSNELYLPGTFILKPEAFDAEIEIKQKMKERQYLDYTLLKTDIGDADIQKVNEKLDHLVRSSDVLGVDHSGNLMLLLTQTHSTNQSIILDRMKQNGFHFEAVNC